MGKKMSSSGRKGQSGTQEWAEKTVNCCTGCSNNCRYCYARQMAVRFKQVTENQWPEARVREHDVVKKHRDYRELVMFPSSHDITIENLDACRTVLRNLLVAGNDVLVVSKPDPQCIQALCEDCVDYKDKVLFRFTIGAMSDELLSLWEPGAPSFQDRVQALKHVFNNGLQTSVSIEPMVDADNVENLVFELLPYVTETVWVGKMNYLGRVVIDSPEMADAVERVRASQTDDRILEIYQNLKDIPQVLVEEEHQSHR